MLEDNPLALLELLEDDNDPPPAVTAQSTVTEDKILLLASFTIATNGFVTAVPTVAD